MRIYMIVAMALTFLCAWGSAPDEEPGNQQYRENFVIPFSIEASELSSFDVFPGEDLYLEIEYAAQPGDQPLFLETAEQVWWVRERALLLLGSTGLPLPFAVCKRKQVFVQLYLHGEPVFPSARRIFPRKNGFEVASDAASLKQQLQKRLLGVDAPYLAQVSNYLALNVATLDVRGDTLTIDTDGYFGGILETSGFRMATGASDGRVLSCDADGDASWMDPSSGGFSLPYSGSGSSATPLFSLEQTGTGGTGGTMKLVSNLPSTSQCLILESDNPAACILSTNTFESSSSFVSGNAGYFKTTNPNSKAASIYVESSSNVDGYAIYAAQKGESGRTASFGNHHASNGEPAIFAYTYGPGQVLKALNYHPTSGSVAEFEMANTTNSGNIVVATSKNLGSAFVGENIGTGQAATFSITNASNTDETITVNTNGLGMAGLFEATHTTRTDPTLKAVSHSDGAGLHVVNDSMATSSSLGAAGFFECTNPSGVNTVIHAKGAGEGSTVFVESTGIGRAGEFTSEDSTTLYIYNDSVHHNTLIAENNGAGGKAASFQGNVAVTGTLSKTAGSFRIDHPLDPEHKYLQHSFVESPDMMNMYNGVVTLDGQGEAWVQLPDWFEALNRSFRYQLTALGKPGPNLYIAEKIDNLRFQIAGGEPKQEVSWQVTGIRQDPYALDHPIKTELDKPRNALGKYVYPQGYGADQSARIMPKGTLLPKKN